jgi:hypothetical protein
MNVFVEDSLSNLHISTDAPKIRLENPVEEATLVSCQDDERCYDNIIEKEDSNVEKDEARDTTLPSTDEACPKDEVSDLTKTEENEVENVVVVSSEIDLVVSGAEDQDDASVYTYGTNGTSESSVHDIISRLHSETKRRRKRLLKRRSGRKDSLQKYISRASSDPVLGMTLDIDRIEE